MYIRFLFNLKVFLYIVNVLFLLFLGFFYIDNNGFVISGNDLILI